MTNDFSDIYITTGSGGTTLLRCKRCNDKNVDFSQNTRGMSLGEVTEFSIKHLADHDADAAQEQVRTHAPFDNDLKDVTEALAADVTQFAERLQVEVREFGEQLLKDYGPALQKAVTNFGIGKFFK